MQTEHVATQSANATDRSNNGRDGVKLFRRIHKNTGLIASLLLTIIAMIGEFLSLRFIAAHPQADAQSAYLALGLHLLCAVVAGVAALLHVPAASRQPKLMTWSLTFLLCLSVPMLGVLLMLSARVGYTFRTKHKIEPILAVDEPVFSIQRAIAQQRRKGSARVNVMDTTLSASERINAQLALQDAPGKISADLLRTLLTDSVEDIRLLAYGLLDGKEKQISQRILIEQEQLKTSDEAQELYAAHRRLAELNWELIYQRMVQGDMRRYSGDQSLEHAKQALAIKPDDAGLWFMCARVLLSQERPDDAESALNRARTLGMPDVQLLPYFAEMAFERRDLQQVQDCLSQLQEKPSSKALGAVHEYWT
jgi:polysaccharide biosynthesis protein PelE